jgi:hypothetical protein
MTLLSCINYYKSLSDSLASKSLSNNPYTLVIEDTGKLIREIFATNWFAQKAVKSGLTRVCHLAEMGCIGNHRNMGQSRIGFDIRQDIKAITIRKFQIEKNRV